MNKRSNVWRSLIVFAMAAAVLSILAIAPIINRSNATNPDKKDAKFVYPTTKKVDQVDDYFGTKVPDPYRWLEDENSAETKAWVDAQNALTFSYLDRIPYREKLKARLTELYNYPKVTAPFRRGNTYFVTPSDPNYVFIPGNIPVTVGPDKVGIDFKAYHINALSLEDVTNQTMHIIVGGANGQMYHLLSSSNLFDWTTVTNTIVGPSNYWELFLPIDNSRTKLFRTVTP